MNRDFLRGLRNVIRGGLIVLVLIVTSITVFFNTGDVYWNDIAFCVWCICLVQFIQYMDELDSRG